MFVCFPFLEVVFEAFLYITRLGNSWLLLKHSQAKYMRYLGIPFPLCDARELLTQLIDKVLAGSFTGTCVELWQ
jgi:hypothetical protein